MLAILGHLVTTAGLRWPGNIAYGVPFSDMKTGLAAFSTIPVVGTAQVILTLHALSAMFPPHLVGFYEVLVVFKGMISSLVFCI
jgi:hypothetical protein